MYYFEKGKFGKLWETPKIHSKDVTDVLWNFDETKVITCSKDKSIKMWNYEDGQMLAHIEDAHKDNPMAMCRFEGSRDFFSGGIDGSITCWDGVGNKVFFGLNSEIYTELFENQIPSLLGRR